MDTITNHVIDVLLDRALHSGELSYSIALVDVHHFLDAAGDWRNNPLVAGTWRTLADIPVATTPWRTPVCLWHDDTGVIVAWSNRPRFNHQPELQDVYDTVLT